MRAIPLLDLYPREMKIYVYKKVNKNGHSSFIDASPQPEATQMRMDKQIVYGWPLNNTKVRGTDPSCPA